jgi:N-acetylglucosaminyldiphosphoundecaprenol N-acetyl-beta-D-mannosaminyltransferase
MEVTMSESNNKSIRFLGFPLNSWTLEGTVESILTSIREKRIVNHVVLNAAKIVYAKKSPTLKKAILNSDIINADGQSIVWGARLLGINIPERVTGIDLFIRLLSEFEKIDIPVFFLGAKDDILNQLIQRVKSDYPKLKIAGYRNGYFSKEEEIQICEMVNESYAQALFIGISSPKKESFLLDNSSLLKPYFRMGVGGSFDVVAGHTKRAPKFMQKIGLEWLYRIYQEPRRMWKRYAVTNTLFLYYLLKEVAK